MPVVANPQLLNAAQQDSSFGGGGASIQASWVASSKAGADAYFTRSLIESSNSETSIQVQANKTSQEEVPATNSNSS